MTAEVENIDTVDEPSDETAMQPKKMAKLDIQPRFVKDYEESFVLQDFRCNKVPSLERCKSCIMKKTDLCRFKFLRAHKRGEDDELEYGPYFIENVPEEMLSKCLYSRPVFLGADSSEEFIDAADSRSYIWKSIERPFLHIISDEKKILDNTENKVKRLASSDGFRQICDSCQTTIVNLHYLCCICAMEICKYCYEEWADSDAEQKHMCRISICSFKRIHGKNQMVTIYRKTFEEIIALRKPASYVGKEETSSKWEDILDNYRAARNPLIKIIDDMNGKPCIELLSVPKQNMSLEKFMDTWRSGQPVVIEDVAFANPSIWTPSYFLEKFGNEKVSIVDCRSNDQKIRRVKDFFVGFADKDSRIEKKGLPLVLKLKDWPAEEDFKGKFPEHYKDLMEALSFPIYFRRRGAYNLAAYLPPELNPPDLGPKMYLAYECEGDQYCTTSLHLDMADAVNVMVSIDSDDAKVTGAIWDVYRPEDLPKIRQFLRSLPSSKVVEDPIHDQVFFLNSKMREDLRRDYGVIGYRIYQKVGDAVYIPAGFAHQVFNVRSCIKVALDFVSPESVVEWLNVMKEFRRLPVGHARKEDLLQAELILYYAGLHAQNAEHKDIAEKGNVDSLNVE